MKKLFITFLSAVFTLTLNAQDVKVQEPDFVGQALILKADGTTDLIDRVEAKVITKMKFRGGYTQTVSLEGCCSSVATEAVNGVVKVIIKVADNKQDPIDVLQIVNFDKSKRERSSEIASLSAIKGLDQGGKVRKVSFYGKKYGESSYLLTISIPASGEYGIFIQGKANQSGIFVSAFNVK